MVRHAKAAQYEDAPRPIIAVANDYPSGHLHPLHRHRRAQLLHGVVGTMVVTTEHGSWVVPPELGVWIPAGVLHGFRMIGDVTTHSVYLEPAVAKQSSKRCYVVGIPALLHDLMAEAVDLPVEYEPGSRADLIMALLLREVQEAPALPFCLPFPEEPRLAARCRRFLDRPTPHDMIDTWAVALGMSRRAFTRQFRRETGLSLAQWQRQACLLTAVSRLSAGEPITAIALDLGYASPAAFTTMFKRVLGVPPSRYRGGARTLRRGSTADRAA